MHIMLRSSLRLTMSAKEKKEKVNQNKRASRRRIKDIRSDTLHPDSIAIENPHFEPKLISPNTLNEPVSPCDLEIPILHGGTGYIPSTLEDPPQEAEPSILVGKKRCSQHVTPGVKDKFRSLRTKKFESTIGRNTKRSHEETRCDPQPTNESTVTNAGKTHFW